jgi:hypothetical protein
MKATDMKASIGQLRKEEGMGFFSRRCSTRIAKKGIPRAAFIILLVRVGAGAGGAGRGAAIMLTIFASLKVECMMRGLDVRCSRFLKI